MGLHGAVPATIALGLASAALSGIGCSGDDVTAPNTGSIEVTTVTSGPEPDPDGYAVSIDGGAAAALGANASTRRDDVDAGEHLVQLGGIAANCGVQGSNPRPVTVAGGSTAAVTFVVTCTATTGSLEITTTTTGGSPDPDGYTVAVDNSAPQTIGVTSSLMVPALSPAAHEVTLAGLAANCRVEGDNPRSVTVTAGAKAVVAFNLTCPTPVSSRIAFVGVEDGQGGIYLINADGSGMRNLTRSSDASEVYGAPAWSPDGSKILFLKTRFIWDPYEPPVADIWVINADGTHLTNLTRTPGDEEYTWVKGRSPVWSPDGRRIAFARRSHQEAGLYVMDADGTDQTKLVDGSGARDPTWSPDSRKIAFEDGYSLDVINPDGSGAAQVSHFNGDSLVTDVDWSPDASRFSFLLEVFDGESSDYKLWVMNADGSAPINLTGGGFPPYHSIAAWSPDGSKLAYSLGGIHVINRDGTGVVRLTDGEDPDWSPDGSRFTYTNEDVFVVNADGTGATNLTHDPGLTESFPAWSP